MSTATNTVTPAEYVVFIERATERLTAPVVAELRKAYRAWQAGGLGDGQLADVIAAVLMIANAHARGAGDAAAAAGVGLLAGHPDPRPIGKSPGVDVVTELARLTTAADTLLTDLDDPDVDLTTKLDRIGHAEPAQAMRNQMRATYETNGATGWYRGLNADACALCQSWAGAGTFPASVEMLHHPGCSCVPIPTTERTS